MLHAQHDSPDAIDQPLRAVAGMADNRWRIYIPGADHPPILGLVWLAKQAKLLLFKATGGEKTADYDHWMKMTGDPYLMVPEQDGGHDHKGRIYGAEVLHDHLGAPS